MMEGKARKTRRKAFTSLFASCHMKEMPAVTLTECEQGDVCKLPERPSQGQREKKMIIKRNNKRIVAISCYFRRPELSEEKQAVLVRSVLCQGKPDAIRGAARTSRAEAIKVWAPSPPQHHLGFFRSHAGPSSTCVCTCACRLLPSHDFSHLLFSPVSSSVALGPLSR